MQRKSLRVSVALTTYNGSAYLAEQLRSILDQTRMPQEIVVGDDGSDDRSIALVRRIIGDRLPLRVLTYRRRLGIAENMARVLDRCRGDLIVLSDQDDRWLPNRLAIALGVFEAEPEAELLFGNAHLISADGTPLRHTLFQALPLRQEEAQLIDEGRGWEVLIRRNVVTGATVALRRELWRAARPIPPLWLHDEWLAMIAAARGTLVRTDAALIEYRQHGGNLVGVRSPSFAYRVGRVREARGDRHQILATRSLELAQRITAVCNDPQKRAQALAKAEFEASRASYPRSRCARVLPILRQVREGGYRQFASQGRLDIIRDLLQPG